MMHDIPRIVLAAPKSGSGKTTIACGLLQYFKEKQMEVSAFKCGPDYIDPMFHKTVIEVPSYNLDSFFSKEEELQQFFVETCKKNGAQIALVEGVMGLYDGLAGIYEKASTMDVARILKSPIILVIDAHGMGRSMLPLLKGFLDYDKDHLIKGVILNRTTKSFYQIMKPVIEEELPIKVVGFFPKQDSLKLESRHLGLKLPGEMSDIKQRLKTAASLIEESFDMDCLLKIAGAAVKLSVSDESLVQQIKASTDEKKIRLAYAKDEAFCFYYEQNLKMFTERGVEMVPFSPCKDKKLPDNIQGLLLGGGYPELYAEVLSNNREMLREIKKAVLGGMPTLAECGGFMYLHNSLTTQDGKVYPMVGAIDAEVSYQGKLVRFGYIEVENTSEDAEEDTTLLLQKGETIKAHEFHYFDSTNNGDKLFAKKPMSKRGWSCVHLSENQCLGFPHFYYPSNAAFVERFIVRLQGYLTSHSKEYNICSEKNTVI